MSEKCYSKNEEDYIYDDFSELVDDSEVGDVYWEADKTPLRVEDFTSLRFANEVVEWLDERVYDVLHWDGYDNDFCNVSKEAKQELSDLMTAWAKKHVTLNYWLVKNEEQKTLTSEDFE